MLNKCKYPVSWKTIKLGDIAEFKNGLNYRTGESKFSYRILSVASFQDHGVIRNLSDLPHVDLDHPLEEGYRLIDKDLVFVRSNGNPDLVGRCVMIFPGDIPTTFSGFTIRARVVKNKMVSSEWVHICLRAGLLKKSLNREGAGTNITNLNQQILSSVLIPVPSMEEQKTIAAILSMWDEAIEKTERLIELTEQKFRGLQKKLIESPFRNSFEVKLGDVARIPVKQKLENLEDKGLLTVKLHCMGIEANDRIKPRLSETGRPYYARKAGEVLIGRQNFHNGGIGIVPDNLDGGIASNAITSIEGMPGKLHQKFLYWVLSREHYYQKIGHIMDGTGQKELSEKQLLNLLIHLPPYSQQIEISNALDQAKEELCLKVKIHEKLLLQKQGLMQKFLTGKWRVNFKEEK